MKDKIITIISFFMMLIPWTILPLRSFSWALESPVAEIMITGYALFMIFSGVFTAVAYGKGRVQNLLMKISLVVNVIYAVAGAAAVIMICNPV